MEQSAECLVRRFSHLEGLQPEYAVEYRLGAAEGSPCIRVQRSGNTTRRTEYFPLTGLAALHASELLRFLYENAVPPESCGDILADCFAF